MFAANGSVPQPVYQKDIWAQAVALRDQLETTPAEQRTRERYEAVLNAFRRTYHEAPITAKAPAAAAAVADLLAEKGRVLRNPVSLRAALGQYEFLRDQYPESPQAENALLMEGEICRQDLKDFPCAQEKLRAVIDTQPGSSYAEQAAIELQQMDPTSASARTIKPAGAPAAASHIVRITGMRHWSNPTSTRIAIDLGGKVEYEAARVPNPDRIFFDLHGARLAPALNGRQVEVIDDGYLKRIRAAQFKADITRVVLDVTDVSQYSAFLLPNPWRLIIDIHSDKGENKQAVASTDAQSGTSSMTTLPASPLKPSAKPENERSDTVIADVAKLSAEPAKVTATAGPTSAPVSVKVPMHPPSTRTGLAKSAKPALPGNELDDALDATGGIETASAQPADIKIRRNGKSVSPRSPNSAAAALPHAADPASDGQRSLVRALGLKVGRIVIDPGHGGHDSGTLGPGGIEEKDIVLDVALRVGKLLHKRLGAEIVYTRSDDTFIPLETRTAIANRAQADLFLSIHGNSSPEPDARGVETYYLNFTSDPDALEVAARENAVSAQSVHQLSDLVRKIALKDKIDESREFAVDVDSGLYEGLRKGNPGLKDRGVKKAPFVVLIGAQMPSILAEISFLTNPEDAQQMRESVYRQRIAEALDTGVERYLRGLSGTKTPDAGEVKIPAKRADKTRNESGLPAGQ